MQFSLHFWTPRLALSPMYFPFHGRFHALPRSLSFLCHEFCGGPEFFSSLTCLDFSLLYRLFYRLTGFGFFLMPPRLCFSLFSFPRCLNRYVSCFFVLVLLSVLFRRYLFLIVRQFLSWVIDNVRSSLTARPRFFCPRLSLCLLRPCLPRVFPRE